MIGPKKLTLPRNAYYVWAHSGGGPGGTGGWAPLRGGDPVAALGELSGGRGKEPLGRIWRRRVAPRRLGSTGGERQGTPLKARAGGRSAWHSRQKPGLLEQVWELELDTLGRGAGESVPSNQHRGLSVSGRSHVRPPVLPPSHPALRCGRMVHGSC